MHVLYAVEITNLGQVWPRLGKYMTVNVNLHSYALHDRLSASASSLVQHFLRDVYCQLLQLQMRHTVRPIAVLPTCTLSYQLVKYSP